MRSGKMYGRKEKMRIWATEEKRKECVEVNRKVLCEDETT